MDLDFFNQLVIKVHDHKNLGLSDKEYVRDELPRVMNSLEQIDRIREWQHPTDVLIKGAPVRSFLAAYGLLLGKKAFGTRKYIRQEFFDALENRLSIGVMRGNFVFGHPKGFYCCRVCSLAVLPLYEMDLLAHMPGKELAVNLRGMIERREGRYHTLPPKKLLDFSLSF